ncbi:MAG: T9SS type A sorting domain-containing protein [Ferruginibacter sp.]
MKIIFTLIILSVFSLTTQAAHAATFPNAGCGIKTDEVDKKNELRIGSNRESGDMQLYFTAEKEGDAIITILNKSGEIVLQQTNRLTNSNNIIPLKNATALTEGSYTLRLLSNNETYTARFLVWK